MEKGSARGGVRKFVNFAEGIEGEEKRRKRTLETWLLENPIDANDKTK
jgi:hypothetical protein